ncbi:MAG: phosphoribosylformylglycinamidine synthase, partial [Clostridium sp.]|nr:phosphoribosylformylglycinamidine synthase [Clostridium sp.]
MKVRCIFVEKKKDYDVEGKSLLEDFKSNLGINSLESVRLVNKYTLGEIKEEDYKKALYTIFSERTVDNLYENKFELEDGERAFAVEFLPGQYDQRADSASECFQILTSEEKIEVKWTKIIVLKGNLSKDEVLKIKNYYINQVDSREVEIDNLELSSKLPEPKDVKILNGFISKNDDELKELHSEMGLAMSFEDIKMIRDYFNGEKRDPSITEIKVIDTYWSDHCRHTTFSTAIEAVDIEEGLYTKPLIKSYNAYLKSRDFVYGETNRDETLMDIAV